MIGILSEKSKSRQSSCSIKEAINVEHNSHLQWLATINDDSAEHKHQQVDNVPGKAVTYIGQYAWIFLFFKSSLTCAAISITSSLLMPAARVRTAMLSPSTAFSISSSQ